MEEHLYRFNYEYDKEQLLKEFHIMNNNEDKTDYWIINTDVLYTVANGREDIDVDNIFPNYHDIEDKEKWDNLTGWRIRSLPLGQDYNKSELYLSECKEMKRMADELTRVVGSEGGNLMIPYFLTQEENSEVPIHIDMGFSCAINMIIEGGETPVYFRDDDGTISEYNYENALLNVCGKFHGVPEQQDKRRVLLKFRIVDVNYYDAMNRLKEYFGDK